MNIAHSRNSPYLSLMDGEASYKLQWGAKKATSYRVVLGQNPVIWLPYMAYIVLRNRVKRYIYSESTPKWIKNITRKLVESV
jgi:hypothetical protein